VPLALKLQLYYALIVSSQDTEDERKLSVLEMKYLRCLKASHFMTENENVRRRIGVDITILDIIHKKRLKWFGHGQYSLVNRLIKISKGLLP